jgi:8-oxo-dGTP pyrophosphatase MutT (NUDIX family)
VLRPEDALARLPVPLRRAAYRVAHRGLTVWWRVRRPDTQGVKCLLVHEGRVLFVRHTYGDRELWELPGGGLRRGEDPAAAAAREAREELGVDLAWRWLARVELHDVKTTVLHVLRAETDDAAVAIDPGEIAQARWAEPHDPPRPLSASSRAILELPPLAAP